MKDRYENLDEYIADLRAALSQNDGCANHHYNLGVALLSKGDFVAAEESFLAAVRNSSHLAEAYVQLGGICLQRGDLEGCLRYNEEAANCRAKFPVPWSNIGFVQFAARRARKGHQRPAKGSEMGCRIHSGDGDSRRCLLHERTVRREHQNQRKGH